MEHLPPGNRSLRLPLMIMQPYVLCNMYAVADSQYPVRLPARLQL